jgi:hypothetical protein
MANAHSDLACITSGLCVRRRAEQRFFIMLKGNFPDLKMMHMRKQTMTWPLHQMAILRM